MDRSCPDLSARQAPEICIQDPSREQDSKSRLMCSTPNVKRMRLEMTDQIGVHLSASILHPACVCLHKSPNSRMHFIRAQSGAWLHNAPQSLTCMISVHAGVTGEGPNAVRESCLEVPGIHSPITSEDAASSHHRFNWSDSNLISRQLFPADFDGV